MANLKKIMRGGESATLEFKETSPGPWKLAQVIASFANSAGGDLVVGVDDGGNICGVADIELERNNLEMALEYIEPRPGTKIELLRHDLRDVLVMKVEMIDFPSICYVDSDGQDSAYFRIKKETRVVDRDVVKMATKLRRRVGGVREISTDGEKLVNWLWSKGEAKEAVCANRLNFSAHRLRKMAEGLIGAGYLLPCNIGSGRTYVAIHPGPRFL